MKTSPITQNLLIENLNLTVLQGICNAFEPYNSNQIFAFSLRMPLDWEKLSKKDLQLSCKFDILISKDFELLNRCCGWGRRQK
jgi:hypothetical protein